MTVHNFPDRFDVLVKRATALRNEMIERCQKEGGTEMVAIYQAMTIMDIGKLYDDPVDALIEFVNHLQRAHGPLPVVLARTDRPLMLKIWTASERTYQSSLESWQACLFEIDTEPSVPNVAIGSL